LMREMGSIWTATLSFILGPGFVVGSESGARVKGC
jgi:hypothetical protein